MLNAFDRRAFLCGASALALPISAKAVPLGFDAVVTRSHRDRRGRTFPTIAAALDAAPAAGKRPYRVLITAGVWREKLTVAKANIWLEGEGMRTTTVTFDDYAGGSRHGSGEVATLVVSAPDFCAKNLTIANDFDYPGNMPPEVPYDRTGASGAQATALKLAEGSDRAYFEKVALTGWQDTLYTDAGRSLFRHCYVSGCVDFIFGRGVAVFDHCQIHSRTRPGKDFHGFIAAPDTDRRQPYGLIFLDCRLTKDADMPRQTMALGRPWRRTMTFPDGRYGNPDAVGQTVFLRCWMDDHIVPEGWYPMHYNLKGGGRAMYQPEDARLFEYASRGPGAGSPSARRRQLTALQARAYNLAHLLSGWSPT